MSDHANATGPGPSSPGSGAGNPLTPDKLHKAERVEQPHAAHAGHLTREYRRPGPSIWILAAVVLAVVVAVAAFALTR